MNAELQALMARLGLRAEDCEEQFTRSSGPGGQHVNKVETAVRIVHRPTGLQVTVQESRSQARNRELAYQRLAERLEADARQRREEARQAREKKRRQQRRRPPGVQRRILEGKRRRSRTKSLRRAPSPE